MTNVEGIRETLQQGAPKELRTTSLEEGKRELLQEGFIERLVMDGRTPIRICGMKFQGLESSLYIVPPEDYNENHPDYDFVEKFYSSGPGSRTFVFKDGTSVTPPTIELTPEEEVLVKGRIIVGRQKREEWKQLYEGTTSNS